MTEWVTITAKDYRRLIGYVNAEERGELVRVVRGCWIGIDDEPHEKWEFDHCGEIVEHEQCSLPNFCHNCSAMVDEYLRGVSNEDVLKAVKHHKEES